MPKKDEITDLTGLKFGRLTVIAEEPRRGKLRVWLCHCDCGKTSIVYHGKLSTGYTQSCGCIRAEALSRRNTTHGSFHSSSYRVWQAMKARCNNPNIKYYRHYGGRGITVCDRWQHDFTAFMADMGPRPSLIHSIDRIDPDGNYEPINCRWATPKEQNLNRRCMRSQGKDTHV